jgi:hypothetical protein
MVASLSIVRNLQFRFRASRTSFAMAKVRFNISIAESRQPAFGNLGRLGCRAVSRELMKQIYAAFGSRDSKGARVIDTFIPAQLV